MASGMRYERPVKFFMLFPVSGECAFAFVHRGGENIERFTVEANDRFPSIWIIKKNAATPDQRPFEILDLAVLLVLDLHKAGRINHAGDIRIAMNVQDPDVVH